MKQKRKILIVSSSWVGKSVGGLAQMSLVLARELAQNHQVTVLINRWDTPVPRYEHRDGFDLIFIRLYSPCNLKRPIRGFIGWLLTLPSQLRQFRELLRDREIDIVQIRFPGAYHYIIRIARLLGGPPYCVSFHGSDVWLFNTRDKFSRALVRWVLAGASGTSAVSHSLARDVQKLFPKIGAVRTIHNGKSIDRITAHLDLSEIPQHLQIPEYFFINPANVTRLKGQDILIRVWPRLPDDLDHIHLLIAGEGGESWRECVDLIQELDCGDRVHLLGPLSQPELFSLMGCAIGCIMASQREGFSGSVLEAGALRLALICSDIPSFREIIRHGENGLLVPLDDLEAMVSAISAIARDVALQRRLGDSLYQDVCAYFTAHKMADDYLRFYVEILERETK